MSKFLDFQATAAALIEENGSPVVVTSTVEGELDPVTDETTTATTDATYFAVAFPPTSQAAFKIGNLEGRNVMEIYFALQNQPTRPKPGDTVVLDGETYKIFHTTTHDPALDGPILTVAYAER